MSGRLPDFVIIGAMKCATSTLHALLAANGCFMSEPKEPCFFSDNDVFARGVGWYANLFTGAAPGQLAGESSTHYTKRPQYPDAIARMASILPEARLVYVMRDPVDRLASHYIHEWSEGRIRGDIERAVARHEALINCGLYAYQIRPWLDACGPERVLPVFFERLWAKTGSELRRIGRFIGMEAPAAWQTETRRENRSSERLRKGPLLRLIMETPGLAHIRRGLVPRGARELVKNRLFRMRRRPELGVETRRDLEEIFDRDLAELSRMLGLAEPLACAGFAARARELADPRFEIDRARSPQRPATEEVSA